MIIENIIPKSIGVYKITNLITEKVYIGSCITDFKNRLRVHRFNLKNNKHHSKKLQNSYNKYGSENFKFEVLEDIKNKSLVLEREQYYIDFYNSFYNGYNCNPIAANCEGRPVTQETRDKISKSLKGRKDFLYERTQEHRDFIKKRKSKKVYQYDMSGSFIKEWNSAKEIGEIDSKLSSSQITTAIHLKNYFSKGYFWYLEYRGEKTEVKISQKTKIKYENRPEECMGRVEK